MSAHQQPPGDSLPSAPPLPPVTSGLPGPSVPSPAASDPEALLAAARRGDEQAFWALLVRYRAYLRHVAASVAGRRPGDCDSEVTEACLRAKAGIAGFRGATTQEFCVWLARIVRNLILDRRERPAPGPLPADSSGQVQVADRGPPPPSSLQRREEVARLLDAVDRLPELERELARLRGLQRLPHQEVARRLGISHEYARVLWLRVLKRLRQELGDES
jgi:RNA polymerase sigma-70 factor (ECF subfamily)